MKCPYYIRKMKNGILRKKTVPAKYYEKCSGEICVMEDIREIYTDTYDGTYYDEKFVGLMYCCDKCREIVKTILPNDIDDLKNYFQKKLDKIK